MLDELNRKFPGTKFELNYFDPSKWDTHTREGMEYMLDIREKYEQTQTDLKRCVRVCWENGAASKSVAKVVENYLSHTHLSLNGEFKTVPNIGWDEDGNPVQMGLFKIVFTERDISNEVFETLSDHESDTIDEVDLTNREPNDTNQE